MENVLGKKFDVEQKNGIFDLLFKICASDSILKFSSRYHDWQQRLITSDPDLGIPSPRPFQVSVSPHHICSLNGTDNRPMHQSPPGIHL
ncbi:unnamed protein product, partial [Nesidiocoris tenuis]